MQEKPLRGDLPFPSSSQNTRTPGQLFCRAVVPEGTSAMLGLTAEGMCQGALAGGRSPPQLHAAMPGGASSSAPRELLVRREREEAASSKMALMLSASQSPSAAPTSGLVPGTARTSSAAHTAPKSGREQEEHPSWVAGGGRGAGRLVQR